MRKLILISVFVLASISAQAGDRGLILAANDTPAAATTTAPAATSVPAEAKPAAAKSAAAKPAAAKPAETAAAEPETTKKQASRPRKIHARHAYEGDEAKARRIAARYGVYW